MLFYVTLETDPSSKPVAVDLTELPNGQLEAKVDGVRVDLDVAYIGGQVNARVDGHIVDLTTEGAPPELGIVAGEHRSYVRVESERLRLASQAKGATAASGGGVIKSPMPGRVVKVLVAKGDTVESGQGLVVLEAMKMENEVRAKAAGTVVDVHVKQGATVEGGAKLVTLG